AACAAEITDPKDRRYRYPFTNCTHCGPRLSIIRAIPYDRGNTSMAEFEMCSACAAEYRDPADRRFHAQPNACPVCGPKVWLAFDPTDDRLADPAARDAIDVASRLLARGAILAIKGIGGFHLACDATNPVAVARLRERKRRSAKPFALMARDLEVIRGYCRVSPAEAELLSSTAAPIVLLDQLAADADLDSGLRGLPQLAAEIAPGQSALGLMLPYSPLHRLLLQDWERPLVMTSGNLSDEPQCIDNADALQRLAGIADAWLLHDREILNRVDDSVARVIQGHTRWLRRARGAAPTPLRLPSGFESAPKVLALGGELKNSLCLLSDGQATLSQHLGDLEEARTAREFERTVKLYQALFEHQPEIIAVDCHPDYRSSALGRRLAAETGARLVEVQHHAAHLGAVLADADWPLDAGPVVGVIFDGLGYGADQTIWGGEFLLGDYRQWQRIGHLRPFSLPGGERAIREPWRCLFAQLESVFGWQQCLDRWGTLEPIQRLQRRPLRVIEAMIQKGLNSPPTTSAGRLFDAVAAALGVCVDGIAYEAQAAIELETLARGALGEVGYAFAIDHGDSRDRSDSNERNDRNDRNERNARRWQLDPTPMWTALLDDLTARVPAAVIAARFHAGLATAAAELAVQAAHRHGVGTVALSGGVFQNRTLFEAMHKALSERGLQVLTHRRVPANDGGLALGQSVIAALAPGAAPQSPLRGR
ncbi:MAG: carbamoyltransferase HypF, partial [Halochromatium sp.]|nr:carbamoyltransferase HypF [Halochromatium sp.]